MGQSETSSEPEDDRIRQAYEEWEEGASLRHLEAKYGVSKSKLSRLFQRMNEEAKTNTLALSQPQAGNMSVCNGELTSKVFQLLDDGTPLSRIVIDLKVTPQVLQSIHRQWVELKLEQARSLGYYTFASDALNSLILAAKDLGRALLQVEIVRKLTDPGISDHLKLCTDCLETLVGLLPLFDTDGPTSLQRIDRLKRQAGPKSFSAELIRR